MHVLSRNEIKESIQRCLRIEDTVYLRELLETEIESQGWLDIREKIFQAVNDMAGGFDNEFWYRIQYTILDTLNLNYLAVYDGDIQEVLCRINETHTLSSVIDSLETEMITEISKQIENGSTLLLRPENMRNRQSAILIPKISEARKKEIENVHIPLINNRFDLSELWLTGYGFEILSALRAPIIVDLSFMERLEKELSKIGLSLGKTQKTSKSNISSRLREMVMYIAKINGKSVRDVHSEIMEAVKRGYPIHQSIIIEAIGHLNQYRHQTDRMTAQMNPFLLESYINPSTTFTFEDVFGRDSLFDALGRIQTNETVDILLQFLKVELEGPHCNPFYGSIVLSLSKYHTGNVIEPLREMLMKLKSWQISDRSGLQKEIVTSLGDYTVYRSTKIIASYDKEMIREDLKKLLQNIGARVAQLYYIGVMVAQAIVEIYGDESIPLILPWALIPTPGDPNDIFAPLGEYLVLDMLQRKRDSLGQDMFRILSMGKEEDKIQALRVLEYIDPEFENMDPIDLSFILEESSTPFQILSLLLEKTSLSSNTFFTEMLKNKVDEIKIEIRTATNHEEIINILGHYPVLLESPTIREEIITFVINRKAAISMMLQFQMYHDLFEEELLTKLQHHLIEQIESSTNPYDIAVNFDIVREWGISNGIETVLLKRAESIAEKIVVDERLYQNMEVFNHLQKLTTCDEFLSAINNAIATTNDLIQLIDRLRVIERLRENESVCEHILKRKDELLKIIELQESGSKAENIVTICRYSKVLEDPSIRQAIELFIERTKGCAGMFLEMRRGEFIQIVSTESFLWQNQDIMNQIISSLSSKKPNATVLLAIENSDLHKRNKELHDKLVETYRTIASNPEPLRNCFEIFAQSKLFWTCFTQEDIDDAIASVIQNTRTRAVEMANVFALYPQAMEFEKTRKELGNYFGRCSWEDIINLSKRDHDLILISRLKEWILETSESFFSNLLESRSNSDLLVLIIQFPEILRKATPEIFGRILSKHIESIYLLDEIYELPHITNDLVIEQFSSHILNLDNPWNLILKIDSISLLRENDCIAESINLRLDDIAKIIEKSKTIYEIRKIKHVSYFGTNTNIITALTHVIEDYDRAIEVLANLVGSKFLRVKSILEAILKNKESILSDIRKMKNKAKIIQIAKDIPELFGASEMIEILGTDIKSSHDPIETYTQYEPFLTHIQRDALWKFVEDKIGNIAEELSYTPTPFEKIISLEVYPKLIADKRIIEAMVKSIEKNPEIEVVLSGITASKIMKENDDVQKAIAQKLRDIISIITFLNLIRDDSVLICSKPIIYSIIKYYEEADQYATSIMERGFGRFRIERQLVEYLGNYLKVPKIKEAIISHYLKITETKRFSEKMKALKKHIVSFDEFKAIANEILSETKNIDVFVNSLPEFSELLHDSSIQNSLLQRISSGEITPKSIPFLIGNLDLNVNQQIRDAVLEYIRQNPEIFNLLLSLKDSKIISDSDVVQILKNLIPRLTQQMMRHQNIRDILSVIEKIPFLTEYNEVAEVLDYRSREIALLIGRDRSEFVLHVISKFPTLLDNRMIFDSILRRGNNSENPLDILKIFEDHESIMQSEETHKILAEYIRDVINPQIVIQFIKNSPYLSESKILMDAMDRTQEGKTPAILIEKGERLLKRGDLLTSIAAFKEATEIAPDQAEVWFYLAKGLHIRGGRPVKTYGSITADMSDIPKAERYYKKAIDMDSSVLKFWQGLIKFYRDTGRRTLAEQTEREMKQRIQ